MTCPYIHAQIEHYLPLKAHSCMQVVFLTGALVGGERISRCCSSCHLQLDEACCDTCVRCSSYDTARISRAQSAIEYCLQKLTAHHARAAVKIMQVWQRGRGKQS